MRFVIVDDDVRLRQMLRRFLASEWPSASIDEAADGQEALALLEGRETDLVICDLMMPRMDGIGMVKALRSRGDRVPVIMLSGQDDPRTVVTAIRAGVDNYVPKPISPILLAEKIHQTLALRAC